MNNFGIMNKFKMNLHFTGNYGSSENKYEYPCWPSKYIEWTNEPTNYLVSVDVFCSLPPKYKYNIAVLMEPKTLTNEHSPNFPWYPTGCKFYDFVLEHKDYFDIIFSSYHDYGDGSSKFKYLPGGCRTFIRPGERQIYNKTKNIISITSDKKWLLGHMLRHELKDWHNNNNLNFIQYLNPPMDYKVEGLKDFRFEIIIENEDMPSFSEKLIDPILCGCIPIYYTELNPSYLNMFDMNGIVVINSMEQMKDILTSNTLNEEFYLSRIDAIKYNFKVAQEYVSFGDVLWNNGLKEFVHETM